MQGDKRLVEGLSPGSGSPVFCPPGGFALQLSVARPVIYSPYASMAMVCLPRQNMQKEGCFSAAPWQLWLLNSDLQQSAPLFRYPDSVSCHLSILLSSFPHVYNIVLRNHFSRVLSLDSQVAHIICIRISSGFSLG